MAVPVPVIAVPVVTMQIVAVPVAHRTASSKMPAIEARATPAEAGPTATETRPAATETRPAATAAAWSSTQDWSSQYGRKKTTQEK
jgi:hypothetical protein